MMAPHTDFATLLAVAALAIGYGTAGLAQTIVEAKNWDDAVSKLECGDISKNADGSFSVKGLIRINGEQQHNPIINVPEYTAKLDEKKCDQRETSGSTASPVKRREPARR
jgi:hypothetical protein